MAAPMLQFFTSGRWFGAPGPSGVLPLRLLHEAHSQEVQFYDPYSTLFLGVSAGEKLERLDVVIRGLQRNNEDSEVLKDKKAIHCLKQVTWPFLSKCKMNICCLARIKEHMSGAGRNNIKSIQHQVASPSVVGS